MALLHQATLTPSKLDVLGAWAPGQPWLGDADASTLQALGAYRFDDPAGDVGIETHVVQAASGQILHIPVTYRAAPLDGAESSLMGTLQHSVLGERWVYDACSDPLYVTALASAIITGGTEAPLDLATDNGPVRLESKTLVRGSGVPDAAVPTIESVTTTTEGSTTVIVAGGLRLVVLRMVGADAPAGSATLTGTWPGRTDPAVLAYLS